MAEDVAIRAAREEELPALAEMLFHMDAHVSGAPREVLQMTPAGEDRLMQRLAWMVASEDALLLVAAAEGDDRPVAMADVQVFDAGAEWVTPERREQRSAIIDDVWVDPDWRRRGITRSLLERLAAFAESRGAAHLTLEYSTANPEAERTWRAFGFHPIGVRASTPVAELRARLADHEDQ